MKKTKLFVCVAILASLAACNGRSGVSEVEKDGKLQYSPQVNEVTTIILKRQDFARQLLSNGKLVAASKATLAFRAGGPLTGVYVRNGQRIGAGAKIAELDKAGLELALESAEISLRKAELDYYDILAGQGYPASDTVSVPKEILAMAKMRSGYTSARNARQKARYDLSGTVLRAPISGRVADIKLKRYDQAGTDAVCTIVDDRYLDVDFTVLESEYSFLSSGLPVKIIPFSDETKTFYGKVVEINPVVDKNGQILVRARVSNDGSLIDGMNVRVVVERTIPSQMVVPRSAVVIRDNLDVLFVRTPEGKARWVYVNILYSNGDSFAVEPNADRNATLSVGEEVIVSGNLNLADGSEVKLKEHK